MNSEIGTVSANHYYYHSLELKPYEEADDKEKAEEVALKILTHYIKIEDIASLEGSPDLKFYGVNHRFGFYQTSLLGLAYTYSKPKMVKWLREHGADERMYDQRRIIPMQYANDQILGNHYSDDIPTRVVNTLAQKFFSQTKEKDPHRLFDLISQFIQERNWKYSDWEDHYHRKGSRDGDLCLFGESNFSYHVNCSDLSNLFVEVAKKAGIHADKIKYDKYLSLDREKANEKGVIGKYELFDGTRRFEENGRFKFDFHYVVNVDGWHFDLTLMCKYQDRNAVLAH